MKQRIIKDKNNKEVRQYLVRYKGKPADEDEWLEDKEVPSELKRTFRREKRH